jgi:hypothetical protein
MKKKVTNTKQIFSTLENYNKYFLVIMFLLSLLLINEISDIVYFERMSKKIESLEQMLSEIINPPLPQWEISEN